MPKILYSTKSLKKFLRNEKPSGIYLVTSDKILKKLARTVKGIGISKRNIILIPDGEKAKEWNELEKLLQKFSAYRIDRYGVIIALGGGSVGDVVGFASSIYLRGVRYIQVPTTLLSQVDSAHGGKTGINFLKYKNQVGSFYLPSVIVLDTSLLKPLSKEQVIDGLGEILKAGLIKDSTILSLLKKEKVRTLLKSGNLQKLVKKAVNVKHSYIAKDFGDKGARQILNFGHTIGHALELKYDISHGRAVLIGMIEELRIAESLGITPPIVRQDFMQLLKSLGISIRQDVEVDWKTLLKDKKISGKSIALPVIEKEGKSKLVTIQLSALKNLL